MRNELLSTFELKSNNSFLVLQALTRLRQIANHPVLVDKSYTGSSGKFEQIMTGLEDIVSEKHKVLVFSSFVKNLEIIEKELEEKKITYSKLTGSTANRDGVQEVAIDNKIVFLYKIFILLNELNNEVGLKLEEIALVHHLLDQLLHVVGLVRIVRNDGVERHFDPIR